MSGTELLQHSKLNCIVWHRAFARLQIELYRVVDYDRKWSTQFHKDCTLGFFLISLLICHLIYIFFNFEIVLGPMSGTELLQHSKLNCIVWHRAFARLQIELYRVVNYDKKWSTKFHKDCTLGIF